MVMEDIIFFIIIGFLGVGFILTLLGYLIFGFTKMNLFFSNLTMKLGEFGVNNPTIIGLLFLGILIFMIVLLIQSAVGYEPVY